jgi:hypothetical protein
MARSGIIITLCMGGLLYELKENYKDTPYKMACGEFLIYGLGNCYLYYKTRQMEREMKK